MNATGFSDDDNATFVGNDSFDVNDSGRQRHEPDVGWDTTDLLNYTPSRHLEFLVTFCRRSSGCDFTSPGNQPSTSPPYPSTYQPTIWLPVWAEKAATPPLIVLLEYTQLAGMVLERIAFPVRRCSSTFEHLLILSFSMERLIAIVRPLQVCCTRLHYLLTYLFISYARWQHTDSKTINEKHTEKRNIQGAENVPPPLTWHIAVTTLYALTCCTGSLYLLLKPKFETLVWDQTQIWMAKNWFQTEFRLRFGLRL